MLFTNIKERCKVKTGQLLSENTKGKNVINIGELAFHHHHHHQGWPHVGA